MPFPTRLVVALVSVYVFWGGNFLAARFAVETIPPVSVTAMRFSLVGVLLYVFLALRGAARAGWGEWRDAAVTGALLLTLANGGLVWSQQFLPSGMASVLLGTTPMWLVTMDWLWKRGPKPRPAVFAGLFVGFLGILLLARHVVLKGDGAYLLGGTVLMGVSFCWALGSIYSRTARKPPNPLLGVAMQMLCGGGLLWCVAILSGAWGRTDFSAVSLKSWMGLLYLTFCGSLLGYAAYIWLLNNAPVSLVATYAYVNPMVAVLLGWLFAGETLGLREGGAALLILAAVVLITYGNRRPPRK